MALIQHCFKSLFSGNLHSSTFSVVLTDLYSVQQLGTQQVYTMANT